MSEMPFYDGRKRAELHGHTDATSTSPALTGLYSTYSIVRVKWSSFRI
jgi:hypothetical protein